MESKEYGGISLVEPRNQPQTRHSAETESSVQLHRAIRNKFHDRLREQQEAGQLWMVRRQCSPHWDVEAGFTSFRILRTPTTVHAQRGRQ